MLWPLKKRTTASLQPTPTVFKNTDKIFGLDPIHGIPAVSVQVIMQSNEIQSMLDKLRDILVDIPEDQKKGLIDDVVEAFVRNVHLLPASQSHHHNEVGGLLTHSLEVSWIAAQLAYSRTVFGYHGGNSMMREIQPKYRYAAFLCGLFHDIGKPQSDFFKVATQTEEWDTVIPLSEWVESVVGLSGYYHVEFLAGRGFTHDDLTLIEMGEIVPVAAKRFLKVLPVPGVDGSLPPKEVFEARNLLRSALYYVMSSKASLDMDINNLTRFVSEADSTSTENWRNRSTDISKRICNAIQHQIAKGSWVINDEHSPIIVTEDSIFLRWHIAAHGIGEYLKNIRSPNGMDSADRIADILIERGIAEAVYLKDRPSVRYHKVEVSYPKITATFACLRIIQGDEVFKQGTFERLDYIVKASILPGGYVSVAEAQQPAMLAATMPAEVTMPKVATGEIQTQQETHPQHGEALIPQQVKLPQFSAQDNQVFTIPPTLLGVEKHELKAGQSNDINQEQQLVKQIPEKLDESAMTKNGLHEQATTEHPVFDKRPSLEEWYDQYHTCGSILKVIASEFHAKKLGALDVIKDGNQICINTELLKNRGQDHMDVINDMRTRDLIVVDSIDHRPICQLENGGRKTRFIRLTVEASIKFEQPIFSNNVESRERKKQNKNTINPKVEINNIEFQYSNMFRQSVYFSHGKGLPFEVTTTDEELTFNLKESVDWFIDSKRIEKLTRGSLIQALRKDVQNVKIDYSIITIKKNS